MNRATKLPEKLGPIHFIGIGGIGMSGIAEVLMNQGYEVQGSDISETSVTRRLQSLGARLWRGHSAEEIGEASVVVTSTAISSDNPALIEARRRRIPVVKRADMLAELMRLKSNIAIAGTHGKTTTTTMVATLLDGGGFDPTVINGGIIHSYGSNARMGAGEWMVVEADESDGSFLRLPIMVAVVTNIDAEHLDYYGSFDELRRAFDSFVSNLPFYGFAVCCTDHPEVRALKRRTTDRRVISYGFDAESDVQVSLRSISNGRSRFDVEFKQLGERLEDCMLPMPGEHNVLNATAAIAVAKHLDMPGHRILKALSGFEGVGRRFTRVGSVRDIRIIDDYGHHPVEIKAVLKAARSETQGRILAVHQPHRFTRLHHLFDDFCTCFSEAEFVGITDVYSAGEKPIAGANRDSLIYAMKLNGHPHAQALDGPDEIAEFVAARARPGDMVVCLGAGNISAWAHALPEKLSALLAS
ncbi:MAG: UDP-N-acetylmuramate--L-alanine ligase [Rhodobacteraceae bacterium]|nr:UDP-N-acetylmuramate--L-alanine ligase [Paracoccaceae bacterium]